MSDIHGNAIRYKSIMYKINLQPCDHLFIIGDVMNIRNCTVLLGNHEYMFLNAVSESRKGRDFNLCLSNGGRLTLDSFYQLPNNEKDEIVGFIKNMPISVEICVGDKTFVLAHGSSPVLYRSRYSEYANKTEFVVWDRLAEDVRLPKNETFVFGHTPTCYYQDGLPMRIWYGKNRIGMDCGAGSLQGRLACLRLDDMKEFYSEE